MKKEWRDLNDLAAVGVRILLCHPMCLIVALLAVKSKESSDAFCRTSAYVRTVRRKPCDNG